MAHASISKAEIMFANDFPDEAGRLAYGAGLHAARAFIFEREERVPKTHGGLHSTFAQLIRADPAFNDRHRSFLGRTYRLKVAADYGPAQGANSEAARDAIDLARDLIDTVEKGIAVRQ